LYSSFPYGTGIRVQGSGGRKQGTGNRDDDPEMPCTSLVFLFLLLIFFFRVVVFAGIAIFAFGAIFWTAYALYGG
jgi:hypothetical protein